MPVPKEVPHRWQRFWDALVKKRDLLLEALAWERENAKPQRVPGGEVHRFIVDSVSAAFRAINTEVAIDVRETRSTIHISLAVDVPAEGLSATTLTKIARFTSRSFESILLLPVDVEVSLSGTVVTTSGSPLPDFEDPEAGILQSLREMAPLEPVLTEARLLLKDTLQLLQPIPPLDPRGAWTDVSHLRGIIVERVRTIEEELETLEPDAAAALELLLSMTAPVANEKVALHLHAGAAERLQRMSDALERYVDSSVTPNQAAIARVDELVRHYARASNTLQQ